MSKKFIMEPIPPETDHNWSVRITLQNGGQIKLNSGEYAKAEFDGGKYGLFTIGMRPEGYPSVTKREIGGGGEGTIPFIEKDGELYVAGVYENRPNLDEEPSLCLIGGMQNVGELIGQTATRETEEETGISPNDMIKIGQNLVDNRLFSVCRDEEGEPDGANLFAFKLPDSLVSLDETGTPKIKEEFRNLGSKTLVLLHWSEVAKKSRDSLLLAGTIMLMAHLKEQ